MSLQNLAPAESTPSAMSRKNMPNQVPATGRGSTQCIPMKGLRISHSFESQIPNRTNPKQSPRTSRRRQFVIEPRISSWRTQIAFVNHPERLTSTCAACRIEVAQSPTGSFEGIQSLPLSAHPPRAAATSAHNRAAGPRFPFELRYSASLITFPGSRPRVRKHSAHFKTS